MQTFEALEVKRVAFERRHWKLVVHTPYVDMTRQERRWIAAYDKLMDKITVLVAAMNLTTMNGEERKRERLPHGYGHNKSYVSLTQEEVARKRKEAFEIFADNPKMPLGQLMKHLGVGYKRASKWRKEWKAKNNTGKDLCEVDTEHLEELSGETPADKRKQVFKLLARNPKMSGVQIKKLVDVGIARINKWQKEWKAGWR